MGSSPSPGCFGYIDHAIVYLFWLFFLTVVTWALENNFMPIEKTTCCFDKRSGGQWEPELLPGSVRVPSWWQSFLHSDSSSPFLSTPLPGRLPGWQRPSAQLLWLCSPSVALISGQHWLGWIGKPPSFLRFNDHVLFILIYYSLTNYLADPIVWCWLLANIKSNLKNLR